MGAWGIGNFENDDAADWLCDLEEIKDKSLIYKSLNAILENNEYLEAPECCEALAAAEVIYFGISSERNGASDKILKTGVITPGESTQGAWVMMQTEPNIRRSSRDGRRIFPARHFSMSGLRFGTLEAKHPDYHSRADFFVRDRTIELRIPWGLINVTDPSSKLVLWKDGNGATRKTKGIRILALSYKPNDGGVTADPTGRSQNHTDCLPAELTASTVRTYSWEGWETPLYHTFLKESYYRYQKVLQQIPEGR